MAYKAGFPRHPRPIPRRKNGRGSIELRCVEEGNGIVIGTEAEAEGGVLAINEDDDMAIRGCRPPSVGVFSFPVQ